MVEDTGKMNGPHNVILEGMLGRRKSSSGIMAARYSISFLKPRKRGRGPERPAVLRAVLITLKCGDMTRWYIEYIVRAMFGSTLDQGRGKGYPDDILCVKESDYEYDREKETHTG
jgi:hypothetical protein